jgi:hypothetical protein
MLHVHEALAMERVRDGLRVAQAERVRAAPRPQRPRPRRLQVRLGWALVSVGLRLVDI